MDPSNSNNLTKDIFADNIPLLIFQYWNINRAPVSTIKRHLKTVERAASSRSEGNGMKTSKSERKILIIDDDPDYLKVTSVILKAKNYIVVTANNPREAKDKLFEEKPDLIILDIMMDSLFDGYSLCHNIKTSKEYEEFKDIPIIFVSAVKERAGSRFTFDLREQGLCEPDDYLDKPVQPDVLIARIAKLLNS